MSNIMQDTPFVRMDRVSMNYGEDDATMALKDTSFDVAEGEFVAVVGPSGCGKSSLMKVVTGLKAPSSGVVAVNGQVITKPLSFVGMAFQNATLLPWRTIMQNVMLPLEIIKARRAELSKDPVGSKAKAQELLTLVGLSGYEDSFPWELSGGMQQRAQICRALVHNPSLLMLDEPFGALDMFTREELWLALQELWLARKPTVILVTHDLREAAFLADRVLVMSARPGCIIAERKVDLPRPRTLEMTYEPASVEIVHDLRANIGAARSALPSSKGMTVS